MIDSIASLRIAIDTMWVLLTGMLVFFMNLGFAMVESGFCRSKNCANILSKNFIVFAVSSMAFWILGWGLMFGDGNSFVGMRGLWLLSGSDNSPATGAAYQGVYSAISWTGVPFYAKFFFELVFAGTAATIVSGAVAERIKYKSFIWFTALLVGLIYPVVGHWIWGGGWLAQAGMRDFSGSSVVHSVGGWSALAGVIMLGPRLGKYKADGSMTPIPGHNLTSAVIGALVLWLGWFGFNPGSTMAVLPDAIARICVVTNTSASVAILTATIASAYWMGKPDLGMSINGMLAGLVSITAGCAYVSVGSAAIIGAIAGMTVVLGVIFFEKMKLDDPVGALAVHLVHGILGTLFVGLFAQDKFFPHSTGDGLFYGGGFRLLIAQGKAVLAIAVFTFTASWAAWALVKQIFGIRVSPQEELEGLDIGEHGNMAYPEFVVTKPRG